MEDDDAPPKVSKPKPSQTPSWVTLGFILGALFVLALPRPEREARQASVPDKAEVREQPALGGLKAAPHLSTIEAVFSEWGSYAAWSNDIAEIALWSADTKGFTDCYEALRVGDSVYFRSIPRLTRPVLTHGVPTDSPLLMTETEEQRQRWLSDVRKENWRALSEGARQSFGPSSGRAATPEAGR